MKPKKGDVVEHVHTGAVPRGKVLRVSRFGGWCDVEWTQGGETWTKRCPSNLLRVVVRW